MGKVSARLLMCRLGAIFTIVNSEVTFRNVHFVNGFVTPSTSSSAGIHLASNSDGTRPSKLTMIASSISHNFGDNGPALHVAGVGTEAHLLEGTVIFNHTARECALTPPSQHSSP